MKHQRDQIQFGGTTIAYRIERRASRKTVLITVRANRDIDVVAPKGARKKVIAEVVRGKAPWIVRQLDELKELHVPPAKEFVSGEAFAYLGRHYGLKIYQRDSAKLMSDIVMRQGRFDVEVPKRLSPENRAKRVRESLIEWYKDHAKARLPERVKIFARRFGFEEPKVFVRDQQKRWGSCSRTGQLRFNWRIIMAPMRLVDYVVAHELCHLIHQDHSKEFWVLLRSVMPEYEKRREELRRFGAGYRI